MADIKMIACALDALIPSPANARTHSKRQVRQIARSIKEFGFTNPILVDEGNEIIAGHGRYMAASLLGLKSVPAIRVEGLDQFQKRALRIADNRLGETSKWDEELLAAELSELIAADFDAELTGFDAIDLDRLLSPAIQSLEDDDVPPLPDKAISRAGDLWHCGDHVIFCGDARDAKSFDQVMSSEAAMIFTDPPYNVRISGNVSGLGKKRHQDFAMASGEMSDAEFAAFLESVFGNARASSRDGALHFVCMDWRGIDKLLAVGRNVYDALLNICVWVKPNGGMGAFYRSQHELVAVFKQGRAPHVNNVQLGRLGRYRSNVWQYPGATSFSKSRARDLEDHPTVKPIAMVADAIRDATRPGDVVLDPFGGAGTTLLAAHAAGRKAALIELDPKYVDVSLQRFNEATGIEPVLAPDRKSLSAIKLERNGQTEPDDVG